LATASYLSDLNRYDLFLAGQKQQLHQRLDGFYKGFSQLKNEGFKIDVIVPQAAIYLTVQMALHGMKTESGETLATTKDVTKYILEEAGVAIVPFYAFGADVNSNWYRLSVGTCKLEDVEGVISNLRTALKKLSNLKTA